MDKIKALSFFIKSANGRDNFGHLTSYNKGGGSKILYKIYSFKYNIFKLPYIVIKSKCFFYKSFFLDFVCYKNGFLGYVKSIEGVESGSLCVGCESSFMYNKGDKLRIKFLSIGSLVCDIENFPNFGTCFARSQGSFAKILAQYWQYSLIQLMSGEQRLISNSCFCTVGQVAFSAEFLSLRVKKAGVNRLLGRRPHVRGVAMNPVDHCNGGRTKGGAPFRDRWGNLSNGVKTRLKYSKFIVQRRVIKSKKQFIF